MKRYLSGFLTGIIITLSIGGFAAVKIKSATYTDTKITVDGKLVNSSVVSVTDVGQTKGKNYANLNDISKAIGAKVNISGKNINITVPKPEPIVITLPASEPPPPPIVRTVDDVAKECADSVLMIRVYDTTDPKTARLVATASGVILDNGYVLTNKHVTDLGKMFGIQYNNFTSTEELRTTEFKLPSTTLDIALIKSPGYNTKPVKLGDSSKVKIGDNVVTISSPHGMKNTIVSGLISSIHKENGFTEIQAIAKSDKGGSGGAMFDMEGNLIGILYIKADDTDEFTITISINDIKSLLK